MRIFPYVVHFIQRDQLFLLAGVFVAFSFGLIGGLISSLFLGFHLLWLFPLGAVLVAVGYILGSALREWRLRFRR